MKPGLTHHPESDFAVAAKGIVSQLPSYQSLWLYFLDLAGEASMGSASFHSLIIGEAGSGKKELLAGLAAKLQEKGAVAYLPRPSWEIRSIDDFFSSVLSSIEGVDIDPELDPQLQLSDLYSNSHLSVVIEDLQELFEALSDSGQKALRAWLQNNSWVSTWCAANRLFDEVSRQESMFYAFFRIRHLPKLQMEDVNFLAESYGAKISAELGQSLLHLCGQHLAAMRRFMQMGSCQKRDVFIKHWCSLLDLQWALLQREWMNLAPQQRMILMAIVRSGQPVNVKDIASQCSLSHQSASSVLTQLRASSLVRARSVGRESFYELKSAFSRWAVMFDRRNRKALLTETAFILDYYEAASKEEGDQQALIDSLTAILQKILKSKSPSEKLCKEASMQMLQLVKPGAQCNDKGLSQLLADLQSRPVQSELRMPYYLLCYRLAKEDERASFAQHLFSDELALLE